MHSVIDEVERVEGYDAVLRAHSCFRATPLLVTNACHDWPLRESGALTCLRTRCGEATVTAIRLEYDDDGMQCGHSQEQLTMTTLLDSALGAAGSTTHSWYLQWRDLPHPLGKPDEAGGNNNNIVPGPTAGGIDVTNGCSGAQPLMNAIRRPGCISAAKLCQANAWIGVSRTSHLHFDGMDNVLVVLHGEKEVLLFSPWRLPDLYPQSEQSERWKSAARSTLYLQPGSEEYPRLRAAPRLRVVVRPGEALWIPTGWWHEVLTPTMTVALNFWYRGQACAALRPTMLWLNSELFRREYAQRVVANDERTTDELLKVQVGSRRPDHEEAVSVDEQTSKRARIRVPEADNS